ncbi:hypothetical protein [Burkholderia pseudomallei]|uniref:hypothetical protein n=1 Tax=Burkholderia pseudomallei TaxID=28450 RepID=UPI000539044B|nr:hypothetical protein [Burkholderia pseudomallei]KGV26328.1 hypothetical protein X894_1239 [Burkholderia pseudomallei MSHR4462]MXK57944.1 hypothetical protein [Burkholderia pseudomallei]MXN57405.1 hypothetical protein [Burkholderia pseudomallei]CAJ2883713.1 Uncharacterised protein [Burkholderia pseudomallei]CAJ5575814.1 Uncharacterised protein [Burkholderia pseudomallei]
MPYRLLAAFKNLFDGKAYHHRISGQGDFVAIQFYEDLYTLNRSAKYLTRVDDGLSVLNVQNRRVGVKARRGDGSFGEIVPHVPPITDPGYAVKRGPIATIEIGIEVKIVHKAMIKQIDRVITDMKNQVAEFRRHHGNPITIGIAGVNCAPYTVSYEGPGRSYKTTGKSGYLHPAQEADEAEHRLRTLAGPSFDEFLVLRYNATNEDPFPFAWDHPVRVNQEYGAILSRVSSRF